MRKMKKSVLRIMGLAFLIALILIPNKIAMADNGEAKWTATAPMSTPRTKFQTEILDDRIYVIGGNSNKWLSSMEVYNSTTKFNNE